MNKTIISVRHVDKIYNLYSNPRDRIKEVLYPWKKRHQTFYALRDVTFDLRAGEHLGIIGVNGAGKSTLLQILTGVLNPSAGAVSVVGTIGALLELGTGFNGELTGRENARFLLTLKGYGAKEIDRLTEEVQAFADIDRFFDLPMKLYSSGMYVRVAFAVNAIYRPDILIIDEAMAVGDVKFQKKCYDYIAGLKERGTTCIFVTHDVLGIRTFCERMLFLNQGRIMADGAPADVVSEYYKFIYPGQTEKDSPDADIPSAMAGPSSSANVCPAVESNTVHVVPEANCKPWGAGGVRIREMRVKNLDAAHILQGNKLVIECDYIVDKTVIGVLCCDNSLDSRLLFGMRVETGTGLILFDMGNAVLPTGQELSCDPQVESAVTLEFSCDLPVFAPGQFFLTPVVSLGTVSHFIGVCGYDNLFMFTLSPQETVLGLMRPPYSIRRKI